MKKALHYETVSPLLLSVLKRLMEEPLFSPFRLVGGTSLSLHLGHRKSVDIDLFTDASYRSIDFPAIDEYLKSRFSYVDSQAVGSIIGMGKSYYVGESEQDCIKVDFYYTDSFIRPTVEIDGLRLASLEDIAAMKIDVVSREGRKKDFWDIHELADSFPLEKMLELHKERYPYSHNRTDILKKLCAFDHADGDFDPVCLRGKYWEIIKLDIFEATKALAV